MFFSQGLTDTLCSARLSSPPRVALLFCAVFSLGFILLLPQNGVAASVTYDGADTNPDVIGNPTTEGGAISIGGSSIDAHKENTFSSDNSVTIISGSVTKGIYGGYFFGETTEGDVASSRNTVTIDPGGATPYAGGISVRIYGGYAESEKSSSMTASDNTVTINGGQGYSAYGGSAKIESYGSYTATASGNSVNFNGGSLADLVGGVAISAYDASAAASGNTVAISGGTVSQVWGGYAYANSGSADARNNIVTISGGTILWDVNGGQASGGTTGQATHNTVTISGSPNLTAASLYGGSANSEAFSGNTLNVKTSGLTAKAISNFEHLNFYLPSTLSADGTVLTVTGTADLTGSGGRSSIVNVGIDGSSSPLLKGDSITLINATALVTNGSLNAGASGTGMQGVTLVYNFDLTVENNKLLAKVSSTGAAVNEQSKALSEGFVSGLGMVTQGADVAAGQGMDSAVSAAKAGVAGGAGAPAGFGAVSGGSMRYNSGSHVDINSVSLMAGLAWGADSSLGRLTVGPFVEFGSGSYNTYNSFSAAASVKGDGSTRYVGGGVLGRLDLANAGPGNFYVEASGRAGGLENEYDSYDLRNAAGRSAEYDSSSTYYGWHLGTGYVWSMAENTSLDLYGKYFWTRQEGDSVTLSTGDNIRFKDVDSSRVRLGSRFSHAVSEYITPYIGAAYEHEFDGMARATTNGLDMAVPSMRGDTGTCELGLVSAPWASVPLSLDLGVQGYVGKREGVTGSLKLTYEF